MNRGTWIRKASPWSPNGCASLSENRIETRPAQYAEAPPAGNHVSRLLLAWYACGHRDLPWRHSRDPYAIWVSEIMLQQTRAQAVIPYYRRFLARFPTVAALAAAAEDDVLALWSGLGYYSRARNLRRAAQRIATAGRLHRQHRLRPALRGPGRQRAPRGGARNQRCFRHLRRPHPRSVPRNRPAMDGPAPARPFQSGAGPS